MAHKQREDLKVAREKLGELAQAGRIEELLDMVVRLLEQVREENSALRARLQGALRALYG